MSAASQFPNDAAAALEWLRNHKFYDMCGHHELPQWPVKAPTRTASRKGTALPPPVKSLRTCEVSARKVQNQHNQFVQGIIPDAVKVVENFSLTSAEDLNSPPVPVPPPNPVPVPVPPEPVRPIPEPASPTGPPAPTPGPPSPAPPSPSPMPVPAPVPDLASPTSGISALGPDLPAPVLSALSPTHVDA